MVLSMIRSGVPRPIHRDGGMVAGGSGYSLPELESLPPLPTHSCGLAPVDELTGGGIHRGAVWTVAAASGTGATTLAVQAAVAASQTGKVILVNGHVATHLLRDRVMDLSTSVGMTVSTRERVNLASWMPVPWLGEDFWDSACEQADLVILDTFDEMWRPQAWPEEPEARLRALRWLRELAQRHETALLLTARVPARESFTRTWPQHWAHDVFQDVADVHLQLRQHAEGSLLHVAARGRRSWRGTAYRRTGGIGVHA